MSRRRGLGIALLVLLALAWRLLLMGHYYGWEESDYGNLAMVRGVLDGGFLHYDMNHMPGYYGLSALVLAVVDDTVLAARSVSLAGGLAALALAVGLAWRLAGPVVALASGLLLVIQPEFALYAATSLREPLYAAFVLGCLALLSRERLAWAGALAGAAFLVRFDGALVLAPTLALHALGRPARMRRLALSLAPLLAAILAWSAYTWVDHGTPFFWSHAVAVNVETGLGAEAESRLDWALAGARVSAALGAWVLPGRLGWLTWLGLLGALVLTPWRRHGLARTWVLLGLLMTGLWLAIAFTGQHSPEHNLYWKWLCPVVPVVLPLGLWGAWSLLCRLPRPAAWVLLGLGLLQAGAAQLAETRRQVELSAAWYKPQLDLARWIEAEVPPEVPLLVDNIPACWIDRRPHERTLVSWFDVPSEPGVERSFAAWLQHQRIGWVLWFREDWTQAPRVAPFLAGGGEWRAGAIHLVERSREDGYGWILYEVLPATP